MWTFIVKGGPVMAPIIFCSLIGLAIIIDRLWMLWALRFNASAFVEEVFSFVKARRIGQALERCRREQHPLAHVLAAGLEHRGEDQEAINHAMEKIANRCIRQLEQHLGGLISIVGIEPLLGFLGTITGLIRAFMSWERAGANITVSALAGGIYEAMITTAAGLIIAIPYYLAYNYIVSRIKYLSHEFNDYGTELLMYLRAANHSATSAAHQHQGTLR